MKSIGILGGGISGLSSLHWLHRGIKAEARKTPRKLTLYESSDRVGGWINSQYFGAKNPDSKYLFELGPRSLRAATAADVLEMIEDLSLQDEIVIASDYSKVRFLMKDGVVRKLPTGLIGAMSDPTIRGAILKDFFMTKKNCDAARAREGGDSSIEQFMVRHFGEEITTRMVAGIVSGVYAGNISKLSIESCFPAFSKAEKWSGALWRGVLFAPRAKRIDSALMKSIKAKGGVFSFKHGLSTLTDALRRTYSDEISVGSRVEALSLDKPGSIGIRLADGTEDSHDAVISALPAFELARLFAPLDRPISDLLQEIQFINITVVNMAFEGEVVPAEMKGFGFLVPPREKQPFLGVAIDSVVFPSQGVPGRAETRLTVMIGGDTSCHERVPDVAAMPVEQQLEIARLAVKEHLGITSDPVAVNSRVCRQALAQYVVGHASRLAQIEQRIDAKAGRLVLGGASFYGVSVNDCVSTGRRTAGAAIHLTK